MRIPYEPPDESYPINVTNMVDVFLLLLIFFLVATTFSKEERDSKVRLPVAASVQAISAATREVVINIREDGTVTVSGHVVSREQLPATLELAVTASVLAFAVGVPMGVYTGIHAKSLLSRSFMIVSLVGVSLPTFLLGILLILMFSVGLGWLPSFGRGPVTHIGSWWTSGFTSWDGIRALILPAVTLGLFQMTMVMRLVRAEMLEVLRSDYIRFARARGLTDRAINFGHALKNTLVPVITVIGLQFGGIVAFSLVTETVFQWPGMGLLLVQSVASADIPVIAAYLPLIAALFVAINLTVDLAYYAVDPRLRFDA